ncbi:hypothetical protein [Nannocystis radixulma]|uniref:Endonuclease/exonuclease/phosphatase domain-containing protein n=1 Tax=Nannocystis radixulma TaxID=2995305 RepID=A0ABT5B1W9_9BACT|nr:hypothetical protein [Nannocystis radixulma]MDC0667743.1 hypothetical protein [Nannocystis radixulma]
MPRIPSVDSLAASFVLALSLVACGTDASSDSTVASETGSVTSGDGSTTGSGTAASGSTGTTAEAPTTGSATTTADSSTTGGALSDTAASTSGPDPSTTTGEPASTGEASETGEEPPVDACADQDEPPPAVATPKAINDDPAFIQVYVNNIENLKIQGEQCPGDWTDLIAYMKSIEPSPDLFLVQQISDAAQLDTLVARMTDEMPGIFEGIIADADPWTQLSPCGKEKEKQTNAIIIRQGRFSTVGEKHVWQSWVNKDGECVRNHQARTRNVMIKLHDKIADKDITVASMHWATAQGDGPDPACAKANVLEVDQKLHKKGFGGDLVIFGGDFNEPDRKDNGDLRPWYAEANGDAGGALNYRDPIYRTCKTGGGLQACLDDNWTIGSERRIDMLFAQDGQGCRARSRRAHTITFNEAEAAAVDLTGDSDPNLNYSEHRGVRAEFYY